MSVSVGEGPDGGPAVFVSLNPLCRNVPTTVELWFGVSEESGGGRECVPQQNVTATLIPGVLVVLPVNVTALPLEFCQQHCFTVLDLNITGGT